VLVLILRGSGMRSRSSSITLLLSPVSGCLRLARCVDCEVVLLFLIALAQRTSEDVLVLLIGEVNVIVSVGMTELSGVVSVVLPD
jgi:hypothetical protein